jgi:protein-disulfide isomerase
MSTGTTTSSASSRSLVVPGIALLVAVGLAVAALSGGGDAEGDGSPAGDVAQDEQTGDGSDVARTDEQAEAIQQLERRTEGDPLALGDVDAPVVMLEWADFQCPFCGSFARDTKPQLMERYIEEGVLRVEWRDFPVLGEESQTAALAGRAAAEQDAFWELHDEIFAEDRERNAGELDEDSLIAMAADLGLDAERFAEDLGDPDHVEAVQADLELGQTLGITGTPAFLINGQAIIGGQPAETFFEAVERAAAEADDA